MLKRRLETIFIATILFFTTVLLFNFYKSYTFNHNPLPKSYIKQINQVEENILQNMQKNFGFTYKFPIIITDKIHGRLYGLTSYANNHITIYLNKKVMKESMAYILSDVIAHEYAHALMFKLGYITDDDGHSKQWQNICKKLGGRECQRYVNQQEIIMSKLPF